MKSAIVSGANGFVGSAVVRELLSRGIAVCALVHRADISSELDGARVVVCDIEHYSDLPALIGDYRPEVFYHFAWTGTSGPLRGDEKVQLKNVQGTCDAVRAAAAVGCRKFVFASSIMQYEVDVEVKNMQNPGMGSIYSTAKMTADYMARIISASCGIDYNSALISNIFGPGEKSPRLINSSIRKLIRGEHVSYSPGNQMYDFVYISDAARMFAEIGEAGKPRRTYYIGSGHPRPLRAFLEEMRDVVAPGASLGFGELPFNGVSLQYTEFDTRLLFQDTGCAALVPFPEGIKKTKDWIVGENCE